MNITDLGYNNESILRSDGTSWTAIDLSNTVTKTDVSELVAVELKRQLLKLVSEGKIKVSKSYELELAEQFAKEL